MEKLTQALVARREGTIPRHEPIGVLTHHLVHDEGCWQFMAELLAGLEGDPAVRWLAPSIAVSAVARR